MHKLLTVMIIFERIESLCENVPQFLVQSFVLVDGLNKTRNFTIVSNETIRHHLSYVLDDYQEGEFLENIGKSWLTCDCDDESF